MKPAFLTIMLAAVLLMAAPISAVAKVRVFACEPEWASLAEAIGGEYVETYAATHARQDPHHIRARPSLIAKMRQADLVLCSGASLEAGWLPSLLQKAGNARVQPGGEFHLLAAETVPVLEIPETVDRSMGDIHPEGNPHVHLNPHNIPIVAEALTQRLQALDPANAANIRKRPGPGTPGLRQAGWIGKKEDWSALGRGDAARVPGIGARAGAGAHCRPTPSSAYFFQASSRSELRLSAGTGMWPEIFSGFFTATSLPSETVISGQ